MDGKKDDAGKVRLDLLPWKALYEVGKVLTFGATKYGANTWHTIPRPTERYVAAMQRHFVSWRLGESLDRESGLPHISHVACCALFLLAGEVGYDPPVDD